MKNQDKLNAVNPFYQRVGQQYLARIEQENKRRETETKPVVEDKKPIVVPEVNQIAELDRSNWVVVPREFTKRNYELDVNPARLASSPAVKKVVNELELNNYKNTAKDYLGRDFVGNNNWYEFMKMNLALGVGNLDVSDLVSYASLLLSGIAGKTKVYDVSKNKLSIDTLQAYYDDRFKVCNPYRAEYFDNNFKVKGDDLYLNSVHKLENGILVPQSSVILDIDTLMEDRLISLENFTSQGLPSNKTKSGNINYWFPRKDNNSVARLNASSVRADLSCSRNPSYRDSFLGVGQCFVRVEDIK